jgi:hypothetical protein
MPGFWSLPTKESWRDVKTAWKGFREASKKEASLAKAAKALQNAPKIRDQIIKHREELANKIRRQAASTDSAINFGRKYVRWHDGKTEKRFLTQTAAATKKWTDKTEKQITALKSKLPESSAGPIGIKFSKPYDPVLNSSYSVGGGGKLKSKKLKRYNRSKKSKYTNV